ncbi:MAG: flagellar export chaperone FliS [Thermodesulfovibrionales bacterium]
MMNTTCAQNTYVHAMVNISTTPLDLILVLYDGALDYLRKTSLSMDQGNLSQRSHYMARSMAVIEELLASLNLQAGGDSVMHLQELYLYMLRELTMANAEDDALRVQNVEGLLRNLRTAWRQIQ